jgi:hypothetical protein
LLSLSSSFFHNESPSLLLFLSHSSSNILYVFITCNHTAVIKIFRVTLVAVRLFLYVDADTDRD